MDSIDRDVMNKAREIVEAQSGEIHTVIIQLNGRHGGADVVVLNTSPGGEELKYIGEVH